MPIFEYECPNGHRADRYLVSGKTSDFLAPPCPQCGEPMKEVEFSVPAKRNSDYGIQK
jgi:predicted nucleic acid-binding Zn ribbon protein